jgi:hypothetical protein
LCLSGENIDAYISAYRWPSHDPKPVLEAHIMLIKMRGCLNDGEVA